MKFREIPNGTWFRFDCRGLSPRLAYAETLGPFRKVADDGAVHIADRREVKWYVAPAANVVEIQQPDSEGLPKPMAAAPPNPRDISPDQGDGGPTSSRETHSPSTACAA